MAEPPTGQGRAVCAQCVSVCIEEKKLHRNRLSTVALQTQIRCVCEYSRPRLGRVVPCPPVSGSPSPRSATEGTRGGKTGLSPLDRGTSRSYASRPSTHVEDVLSELLRLDAGQHPEQQVHDGRRPDVFDHQVYEVLPLPQEVHNLETQIALKTLDRINRRFLQVERTDGDDVTCLVPT